MHTAYEVKANMFSISLNGERADRELLLDWDVRDRLGVVIASPVGALGASLLTLLAISAFYDSPGRKRRMKPLYPDIFLFHVGGPWGSHSALDFFPDHKEIMVGRDAPEILRQINNRGITHLVVPDGQRRPVLHRFKEPEAAHDRIKRCFVYAPDGMAANGDVEIRTNEMHLLNSLDAVLDPVATLDRLKGVKSGPRPTQLMATPPEEVVRSMDALAKRVYEINTADPRYLAVRKRIDDARSAGTLIERLRRINVDEALEILC